MHHLLQPFKRHWLASFFAVLYALLWYHCLSASNEYEVFRANGGESISYGESVAYTMLFTAFIGFLFVLGLMLNIIFRKGPTIFYWILSLIIAAPIIIVILKNS